MKNSIAAGLLSALALFASPETKAQSKSGSKDMVFGSFVTMPIDFPSIDVGELNDRLRSLGFPEANPRKAAIGWGLHFEVNRVILSLSRNYATRRDSTAVNRVEVQYRATAFQLGYDLIRHPMFSLYPYIGFKSCRFDYRLREMLPPAISFNQYFQSPATQRDISITRVYFDLGVGLSHQLFYIVGVRAGYLVSPGSHEWTNGKTMLEDAPQLSYGPYITLTLGLGNVSTERSRPQLPSVPNIL